MNGVLIRRGDRDTDTHRDGHVRTREEDGVYPPRREASGGTNTMTP